MPGMPVGSPGMDGPAYNGRKDPYDVLLVTKNLMNSDVSTRVFTSYR
ncbi:twin-arginine translocation pathway signal [Alicycliphilus sp. B1]|nr:twin-arginine translocation pathway signal [Alicycliphilus sp. B1]